MKMIRNTARVFAVIFCAAGAYMFGAAIWASSVGMSLDGFGLAMMANFSILFAAGFWLLSEEFKNEMDRRAGR